MGSIDRDAVLVETLRARCGGDLESIIRFSYPFATADRMLLVVLSDRVRELSSIYELVWREGVQGDGVICVRLSDLGNLGLPGPMITTASLPYWVNETGHALYGADVRHAVAVARHPRRMLPYYLDIVRSLRHDVLRFLVRKEYEALDAYFVRARQNVMYAALFSRGQWHVSPGTVEQQFMEAFGDDDLRGIVGEASAIGTKLTGAPGGERKALAHRSAWLFERFVLELSKQTP